MKINIIHHLKSQNRLLSTGEEECLYQYNWYTNIILIMTGCDGHSHDHEHAEADDTSTGIQVDLHMMCMIDVNFLAACKTTI